MDYLYDKAIIETVLLYVNYHDSKSLKPEQIICINSCYLLLLLLLLLFTPSEVFNISVS